MRANRLLLFVALVSTLLLACATSNKKAHGEIVVGKIEQFRTENKRLPESLKELGFEESEQGPVYYRKQSDERYEVWYGARLGESVTYDSERKTWE